MAEADPNTRRVEPARRLARPSLSVPTVRKLPRWCRTRRLHLEHWLAAAIVLLASVNALRLLASD